jgi:hypothetical protein
LVVILSVGLAEGDSMRTEERRDSGQNDLFRARLDQIVDLDHALAKLGRAIDWRFLEKRFGAVYYDKARTTPGPRSNPQPDYCPAQGAHSINGGGWGGVALFVAILAKSASSHPRPEWPEREGKRGSR